MACPTIGEYSIQCIEVHDFLMDFGHKLEVVRSQSTGDIEIRIGPMFSFISFPINRRPFRMNAKSFGPYGMRICSGNHDHAHFPASF